MTRPMGMRSGAILDSQLDSSSFLPKHNTTSSRLGVGSGWVPDHNDADPWVGVDFEKTANVMGLVINGKVSIVLSYSSVIITLAAFL